MIRLLVILLFISASATGQTSYYLNLTTAFNDPYGVAMTPAFASDWEVTTSMARRGMQTSKDNSVITSVTSDASGAASPRQIGLRQYISRSLAAQTINTTQTVTVNMRHNLSSIASSTTALPYVVMKLINIDGTVVRQTIYGGSSGNAVNLTTTLTNRTFVFTYASAGSPVTITQGDRWLFEFGWDYTGGTNTSRTVTQSYGSNNATDLPNDNTTTATNNPVVKFSNTITMLSTPTISTISPNTGSSAGGTAVTITGTNFADGMRFSTTGNNSLTSVVVTSPTSATAIMPAHADGVVSVLGNNGNENSGGCASCFTYSTSSLPRRILTIE